MITARMSEPSAPRTGEPTGNSLSGEQLARNDSGKDAMGARHAEGPVEQYVISGWDFRIRFSSQSSFQRNTRFPNLDSTIFRTRIGFLLKPLLV